MSFARPLVSSPVREAAKILENKLDTAPALPV
jgi:hypothetical protein